MFTISEAQLNELAKRRWGHLLDEITYWLIEEYPNELGMTFADVRPEVQACAQVLWQQGIRDGELVRSHVYACKAFGIDYTEVVPRIGKVLSEPNLSDSTKRAWLSGWIHAMQQRMLITTG